MSEEKRPLEEIKDVMVIEDEADVSETLEMYLNNMDCFEISFIPMTERRRLINWPISHFLSYLSTLIFQEEVGWMSLNTLLITRGMKLRTLSW